MEITHKKFETYVFYDNFLDNKDFVVPRFNYQVNQRTTCLMVMKFDKDDYECIKTDRYVIAMFFRSLYIFNSKKREIEEVGISHYHDYNGRCVYMIFLKHSKKMIKQTWPGFVRFDMEILIYSNTKRTNDNSIYNLLSRNEDNYFLNGDKNNNWPNRINFKINMNL
jgi:hypothetical protein